MRQTALRPLKPTLPELDKDLARGLAKSVVSTKKLGIRFINISKVVHASEYQQWHSSEQRIQQTKMALVISAEVSVVASYANESGSIDWSKVHVDFLKPLA